MSLTIAVAGKGGTWPRVIKAAGLNHFTWMLDLRDRQTGEDLYPLFARRWAEQDPTFEPLTL